MGDQPKVLRRRKKKEVSEFSFLCCIFLAGYFPLEPTFTALGYLGSSLSTDVKMNVRLLFFVRMLEFFSIYRILT